MTTWEEVWRLSSSRFIYINAYIYGYFLIPLKLNCVYESWKLIWFVWLEKIWTEEDNLLSSTLVIFNERQNRIFDGILLSISLWLIFISVLCIFKRFLYSKGFLTTCALRYYHRVHTIRPVYGIRAECERVVVASTLAGHGKAYGGRAIMYRQGNCKKDEKNSIKSKVPPTRKETIFRSDRVYYIVYKV